MLLSNVKPQLPAWLASGQRKAPPSRVADPWGTPTPTPTPTETPSSSLPVSGAINLSGDYDDDKATYESSEEYIEQTGLSLINASSAYARGATGSGIQIAVVDTGVKANHSELDSNMVSALRKWTC